MNDAQPGRPKRLWLAALMNIVVGLLGLFFISFVSLSSRVPDEARLGSGTVAMALVTALFLVASSVIALIGRRGWDRLMLAAALVYYGGVLAQNTYLLIQAHKLIVPTQKIASNIVRSGIEIAINLWAVLSVKTRVFFRGVTAAS
ncbi:hypothetical protein [Pseudoxanthomonas sp. PXM02]|uniref:hypothetical protein n=1 Tax=Pseudoxanthomonas sp. PXM02 TaxID=2769294 RepID=UPI00177B6CF9|nr:hypothetical protein [Pseudoxanthomonas sp. PXM02]MBD9480788.1 hypothetical protein [Pseudoxanthomonas sp. PXM02]